METSFYLQQIEVLLAEQAVLIRNRTLLAVLRLANALAIVALYYFFWGQWKIVLPCTILLLAAFRWLIYRDVANKEKLRHNQLLQSFNNTEMVAIKEQRWDMFADGATHLPGEHPYAADLDILGPGSLFQHLNRTVSDIGSAQLAQYLLYPASRDEILQRQQAVKELSTKITWLQRLRAFGSTSPVSLATHLHLHSWLQEPPVFTHALYKIIRWVLPAINIAVCIAAMAGWIGMPVFYLQLFFMFAVVAIIERKVKPIHLHLAKIADELSTLNHSTRHIENEHFESALLKEWQAGYQGTAGPASDAIGQLKKILDALDIRYNLVLSLPINLLLLWNLQQCMRLGRWKNNNTKNIAHWFTHLGRFEALGSLAQLAFNNPAFGYPQILPEGFEVKANELGHPLIAATKRVNNFIDMQMRPGIMLVTGSNMAGKSTYLRSVGVNMVLAFAGAPTCAQSFSLPCLQLISSMRIADNLQESTSTFYAELKKLKSIIERVNNQEPLFILLDEILRGTNSLDRHTGSRALIKQLIQKNAVAILATHDLALAQLEGQYPQALQNFHFDASISGEELFFDYRLKPGICNSLNASLLMKKIGIEI